MCIVVAQASVSGNLSRVRFHFAQNTTSCLPKGTTSGKLAQYGLVWIALMPNLLVIKLDKYTGYRAVIISDNMDNFSSCSIN